MEFGESVVRKQTKLISLATLLATIVAGIFILSSCGRQFASNCIGEFCGSVYYPPDSSTQPPDDENPIEIPDETLSCVPVIGEDEGMGRTPSYANCTQLFSYPLLDPGGG